jgi:hypothetical protein
MSSGFQYPLKRHDPECIRPLPDDAASVADLRWEGLGEGPAAESPAEALTRYLEHVAATAETRAYYGGAEVAELARSIRANHSEAELAPILARAERIVAGELRLDTAHVHAQVRRVDGHWPWTEMDDKDALPRFGWMGDLTRAYVLTGEERYAACFDEIITDFIADCPVPVDGRFRIEHGAWNALSAGVRPFAWVEAFVAFQGAKAFRRETRVAMFKALVENARYVRKYHAKHGNHALMQLRGLLFVAVLFREHAEATEWREHALRELPRFCRENFYEDGVQFEASPLYHVVAMRDFYELLPLCQKLGLNLGAEVSERLEKAFEVLLHLTTPEGDLPRIGDTESQRGEVPEFDLRAILAVGALLFGREDLRALAAQKFPLRYRWLFAPERLAAYGAIERRAPEVRAVAYSVGGYMVSRSDWGEGAHYLAMRAGSGVGGHCHADELSFVANAFGREWLIDAGKGYYAWNRERKYLVSTRAHNTVVVDGQDQHVRTLHWEPIRKAPARQWDFRATPEWDFFFASQHGYTRYDDPVVHARKVLARRGRYWLVVDLLKAEEAHAYEQCWHFAPGELAATARVGNYRLTVPGAELAVCLHGVEPGEIVAETARHYVLGAWQEHPSLRVVRRVAGPTAFVTVFAPFAGGRAAEIVVRALAAFRDGRMLRAHEATALEITVDGVAERVVVNHLSVDPAAWIDYNGNPVSAELLADTRDTVEIEVEGERVGRDVCVGAAG